jgi:hypothetical protein
MTLSEMTPEEREAKRKYDREAKQRSRAKEKLERERLSIPNAHDYVIPDQQQKKLTEHSQELQKAIAADLGVKELAEPDEYIVTAVACVSFGLEHSISQIVYDPEGMLVGGWFPDAAASEAIEHVHRFPHLLQSVVFADVYSKFLKAVLNWSKKNEMYSTREFIRDLTAELAGTFVLPVRPELPNPEPIKIQEAPPVSYEQILEQGRLRLLAQLQQFQGKEEK